MWTPDQVRGDTIVKVIPTTIIFIVIPTTIIFIVIPTNIIFTVIPTHTTRRHSGLDPESIFKAQQETNIPRHVL
jgi:hypothetical protein